MYVCIVEEEVQRSACLLRASYPIFYGKLAEDWKCDGIGFRTDNGPRDSSEAFRKLSRQL